MLLKHDALRRLPIFMLLFSLLLMVLSPVAMATPSVDEPGPIIVVNGNASNALPQIVDGRSFIPIRAVAEALGIEVTWNEEARAVGFFGRGRVVWLWIGGRMIQVDGERFPIDAAPYLAGDRTMVPVRFVAEALGAQVLWEASTGRIHIDTVSVDEQDPEKIPERNLSNAEIDDRVKIWDYTRADQSIHLERQEMRWAYRVLAEVFDVLPSFRWYIYESVEDLQERTSVGRQGFTGFHIPRPMGSSSIHTPFGRTSTLIHEMSHAFVSKRVGAFRCVTRAEDEGLAEAMETWLTEGVQSFANRVERATQRGDVAAAIQPWNGTSKQYQTAGDFMAMLVVHLALNEEITRSMEGAMTDVDAVMQAIRKVTHRLNHSSIAEGMRLFIHAYIRDDRPDC